jgi:hypothetical protein
VVPFRGFTVDVGMSELESHVRVAAATEPGSPEAADTGAANQMDAAPSTTASETATTIGRNHCRVTGVASLELKDILHPASYRSPENYLWVGRARFGWPGALLSKRR